MIVNRAIASAGNGVYPPKPSQDLIKYETRQWLYSLAQNPRLVFELSSASAKVILSDLDLEKINAFIAEDVSAIESHGFRFPDDKKELFKLIMPALIASAAFLDEDLAKSKFEIVEELFPELQFMRKSATGNDDLDAIKDLDNLFTIGKEEAYKFLDRNFTTTDMKRIIENDYDLASKPESRKEILKLMASALVARASRINAFGNYRNYDPYPLDRDYDSDKAYDSFHRDILSFLWAEVSRVDLNKFRGFSGPPSKKRGWFR